MMKYCFEPGFLTTRMDMFSSGQGLRASWTEFMKFRSVIRLDAAMQWTVRSWDTISRFLGIAAQCARSVIRVQRNGKRKRSLTDTEIETIATAPKRAEQLKLRRVLIPDITTGYPKRHVLPNWNVTDRLRTIIWRNAELLKPPGMEMNIFQIGKRLQRHTLSKLQTKKLVSLKKGRLLSRNLIEKTQGMSKAYSKKLYGLK